MRMAGLAGRRFSCTSEVDVIVLMTGSDVTSLDSDSSSGDDRQKGVKDLHYAE